MQAYKTTAAMQPTSNCCNMGTRNLPDMDAQSLRTYISGKSRASMLQVLCITSGTLKIAQTYGCLLYLYNMDSRDHGIF